MTERRGELVRAIEALTHAVGVSLQDALADLDLDQAQIHVLSLLAASPPLTVGTIHASFGHRRSTLTAVLDRLERRGLARRSTNPRDRRSVIVELTAAGEQAAARVLAAVDEIEQRAAAVLGPTRFAALRSSLGELQAALGAPEDARESVPQAGLV